MVASAVIYSLVGCTQKCNIQSRMTHAPSRLRKEIASPGNGVLKSATLRSLAVVIIDGGAGEASGA
jgi:hypothetical protein